MSDQSSQSSASSAFTPPATSIDSLINEIFTEAGLTALPENLKDYYSEQLKVELQKHLGVKIIGELSGESLEKYLDFIEKNPETKPEQLIEFLQQQVPDLQTKVPAIVREFASRFISTVKNLQAAGA